ncbi:uncharacterized protein [Phaseolus vulgaris]|uniref:uncharacterized protein n=1 Tax=Phaseolus vulgaris TaxID=3885 RepID=UPI0035CA65D9
MISATQQSPTLLEGFPLYWVPGVEFKKPQGLEAMAPYERELCRLLLGAKYNSALLIKHEFDVVSLKKYIDMTSGKDRRRALLELARTRGAKGTGSSSSTTEPIAAPPLSVAPAEGPEPEKKRRRLVKAFPATVAVAADPTPSTEEESSGSPLIHRKRKRQEVGGASSLRPEENEVRLPSPTPQPLSPASLPPPPPAGQATGQPTPPAGSDSAHSGGFSRLPASPPPPTSAAIAEGGEASSQPSSSGTSNENFSRVIALVRHFIRSRELLEWSGQEVDMHLAKQIVLSLEFFTQHRKQLVLEKRIKELEHDKESLQSDFEAAQGSVDLMRDMVEKSRKEYLSQVQETIKTEILMGQAVNALDSEVVELRSKVINLEAETSSLRQLNSQLAGDLKSTKEEATEGGKKLEKAMDELSAVKVELVEAKGKLGEAASSIASLTIEKNALETSKQKLEADNAELMNVGANALADGFELAFEQIRCILPDVDHSQFSIYHEVVDGKLIPPS